MTVTCEPFAGTYTLTTRGYSNNENVFVLFGSLWQVAGTDLQGVQVSPASLEEETVWNIDGEADLVTCAAGSFQIQWTQSPSQLLSFVEYQLYLFVDL